MTRASFTYKLFYSGKPPPNKLNRFKNKKATKAESTYSKKQRKRYIRSGKSLSEWLGL